MGLNSEILMQAYRKISNQVNKENHELKKSYFNREIETVDGDIKRTWNAINSLLIRDLKPLKYHVLKSMDEL